MTICVLCLEKRANFVRIYTKKGRHLQCTEIIVKHFPWMKAEIEKSPKQSVCLACLRTVRDFHGFYQSVVKAYNYLDDDNIKVIFYDNYTTDVLSDEDSTVDQLPALVETVESTKDENIDAEENSLAIEVLEIVEAPIDLPSSGGPAETSALYNEMRIDFQCSEKSTEVCALNKEEDPEGAVIAPPKSGRTLRATRRNERKLIEEELEKTETKTLATNGKKGKRKSEDDDSDVWLPASRLVKKNEKNAKPKKPGRPLKNYENEIKMLVAQENLKTKDNDENESGQHTTSFNAHTVDYDSSDNLSDTDRPERWAAVVAPCSPENPRKRRTRRYPQSSHPTMTQEEKDMKRLQQERYDEIIAKFFDSFPCPKCQHLVCTFGEMRKHFNARHSATNASVLCCGKKFPNRRVLADHVLFHLNPEHFKCLQCDQCFPDGQVLKRHEASHNPVPVEEKPKFNCEVCAMLFSSKYRLKHHTVIKHIPKSEYPFPCNECTKKFPTKSELKKHKSIHHSGGLSMAVICEQCGKTFLSKQRLGHHIKYEHLGTPRAKPERVECPICKITISSSYALKKHMTSVHEQSKNIGAYRCNICGFLSVNERSLKKHIEYIHKTERKFQCTICPKAFKLKNTLKEHIVMHTGEGKTTCPECQMTFACKANYHKHRQRRHGYKPVKRNLIGLAEKKHQKLQAAAQKQSEHFVNYSVDEQNYKNSK